MRVVNEATLRDCLRPRPIFVFVSICPVLPLLSFQPGKSLLSQQYCMAIFLPPQSATCCHDAQMPSAPRRRLTLGQRLSAAASICDEFCRASSTLSEFDISLRILSPVSANIELRSPFEGQRPYHCVSTTDSIHGQHVSREASAVHREAVLRRPCDWTSLLCGLRCEVLPHFELMRTKIFKT